MRTDGSCDNLIPICIVLVCYRFDYIFRNSELYLLLISEKKDLNRLVSACLPDGDFQLGKVVDFLPVESEDNVVCINVIS